MKRIKEFLITCYYIFISMLPALITLAIIYLIAVSDLPLWFKFFLLN